MASENLRDTCPFLIRVMIAPDAYRFYDFRKLDEKPSGKHCYHVYTWMDCTLRELADMIAFAKPEMPGAQGQYSQNPLAKAHLPDARIAFGITYPDTLKGRWMIREIGKVFNAHESSDDSKTLADCNFQVGDFITIKIATLADLPSRSRVNASER